MAAASEPLPLFQWAQLKDFADDKSANRLRQFATARALTVVECGLCAGISGEQRELDLTTGVAAFVPHARYRYLSYRLTEYMLGKCGVGFLKHGFQLERAGIAFLGDLVEMKDHEVERITGSAEVVQLVRPALCELGLEFGMVASRWARPNDGFSHRHFVHQHPVRKLRLV